jgi:hypothetical protein
MQNEKCKVKNVNLKGKEIFILNFAIYTLHFALEFALFQRAKLLGYLRFDGSVRQLKLPAGKLQLEVLSS